MRTLLPLIGTLLIFPLASCKRTFSSSIEPPGSLPPAKNAEEWIGRLEASWPSDLDDLFAELPPLAEWPAVIDRLNTPKAGTSPEVQKKHQLLARLLGDAPGAEEIYPGVRDLVLERKADLDSSYQREKALSYLFAFSPSAEESRAWIEANLPPLKETDPHPGKNHEASDADKLLGESKIDDAIRFLWKNAGDTDDFDDKLGTFDRLLKLGRLLERPELAVKARESILTAISSIPDVAFLNTFRISYTINDLIVHENWKDLKRLGDAGRRNSRVSQEDFHILSLIATYHLEGQDSFMKELSRSPEYGIGTVGDYRDLLMNPAGRSSFTVGELLTRTWHAKGETGKAFDLARHLVASNPGADRSYRLAIELFPDRCSEFFRSLLAYDPYEERPLIWLAEIELTRGNLAEARKLVDQAIALDPSDGEQGKDTRMQVYDVLSRILTAEGDDEKAAFFAGVMKAIREGEEADDFLEAGLIDEAIRRYRGALGHFQDAYCLQSRLALTLMKNGKFEEARKHFEKAFELMPVSFGPVESHCFGCEGIFNDERVQAIALGVFRKFIDKSPDNPRSHYLLGMLLEKSGDKKQALLSYRRALELDPKYYNCALHLYALLKSDSETAGEARSFFPELVAIAPYPKLANHYQQRTDLKQAWIDAQTPPPSPLALPPLPLAFQPRPIKRGNGIFIHHGYVSEKDAVDGWTSDELLRGNDLIGWIDNGY